MRELTLSSVLSPRCSAMFVGLLRGPLLAVVATFGAADTASILVTWT